mgnify:FL=1|jgi:hypothetical protein
MSIMNYNNPSTDKPYISLVCNPYEHETSVNTRVTIDIMQKDLSRDDLCEVFESFMKSMGYHFNSNESLGIEVID